jgi:hypothetical protein
MLLGKPASNPQRVAVPLWLTINQAIKVSLGPANNELSKRPPNKF